MHLLASIGLEEIINKRRVLLDTDFISTISKDEEAFDDFRKLTDGKSELLIDPFTRFELLRHVFKVGRRLILEQFLAIDIFIPAETHPTVFLPILENSLKLSWVYAHNGCTTASPVDVIVASRSIFQKALIITGNRRDFPNVLFKLVGVINYEEGNSTRAYSILEFDQDGYKAAEVELAKAV